MAAILSGFGMGQIEAGIYDIIEHRSATLDVIRGRTNSCGLPFSWVIIWSFKVSLVSTD